MEQLIRHLTTSITERLSGQKEYFTPDDLRAFELPEFLVKRAEAEMYRNLNDSVLPPHSEWANMTAPDVEQAWEQFIQAILAEVRMPGAYLQPVFETAVGDVMELILKPRTAIPDILFGPDETLSLSQLRKRLPFITVNRHLADSIIRFMERKSYPELSRETAGRVVQQVDERITTGYNSLNWAQLLQPLFILIGPEVDTELFRIFFHERGMQRISRRFDLMNGSLTKTGFIETMSSPDLLNEEGYEDDQPALFSPSFMDKNQDVEKVEKTSDPGKSKSATESEPELTEESVGDNAEKTGSESDTEGEMNLEKDGAESDHYPADNSDEENLTKEESDSILGSFQRTRRGEQEDSYNLDLAETVADDEEQENESDDDGEGVPLYSRFDEDPVGEVDTENDAPEETFADQFTEEESGAGINWPEEDEEQLDEPATRADVPLSQETPTWTQPDPEPEEIPGEEDATAGLDEIEDEAHTPIWQSFLGDEKAIDDDSIPGTGYEFPADEEETESVESDEYDEEPLIDLTEDQDEDTTPRELLKWLQTDEDRFIQEIFSGSEGAYEEALSELSKTDSWKEASRYIEKEIFARNLIDMYDETAVDFTDRLQAYFDQFKS